MAYGVSVFGEQLRTGIWLAVQIVCVMLIGVGCVELSRSLASTHKAEDAAAPVVSPRAADA